MQNRSTKPGFHALLIGINCYLPNKLPSGLYYKSLLGCVQDVDRVEAFLRRDLQLPHENITKLSSSNPAAGTEPPEPRSQWPTYENIVTAFKRLTSVAQPGDQVFIHYSGHGGRAVTTDEFKDIKGADGVDEVLVPMDLGDSEGRYLRDTELQFLIQAMVQKKLNVTLVLDSCHAGGATRGLLDPDLGGAGIRGAGVIDTYKRVTKSLVASPAELREAWQAGVESGTRNAKVAGGWLIEPKGYVLIAACRANEYANEIVFEGHEKNGALTYWLVDSLRQVGPDFTYAMLQTRLLAKVHGQFATQSPQLQGEGNRVVFDVTERPQPRSVPVIRTENGLITINIGLAQGVAQGTQFAIYATNEADLTNADKRIAIVEITETGPVSSQAQIVDQISATPIEAGSQAVRLDAGRIRIAGRVRVVIREDHSAAAINALNALQDALETASTGLTCADTKAEPPDFLLTVQDDEFVICDAGGNQLPNLRPAVKISDSNAVERVAERLAHLLKYTNVRELDNNDATSQIAQKFIVELVSAPPDFTPGSPVRSQPLTAVGATNMVSNGDWVFIRIRNNYHPHVLNVTVLDLQPDWAISQIYPARSGTYESLDPGRELILPLHVSLPDDYESGTDIVKVFATLDTTSFRCLELPALDQPDTKNQLTRGKPGNALESFLMSFASPQSSRAVAVDVCATMEWVAHQVEIEVFRKRKEQALTALP